MRETFPKLIQPLNALRLEKNWPSLNGNAPRPDNFPLLLLKKINAYAICNASQYQTSAIAYTDIGAFPGVNIEFPGGAYADTIHAEQCAIINARLNGASQLIALDSYSSPCGHCRQFMLETGNPKLPIRYLHHQVEQEHSLDELLPYSFTLSSGEAHIFSNQNQGYQPILIQAHSTYKPPCVDLHLGPICVSGTAIESAAWNPSITPAQAAFISFLTAYGLEALHGISDEKIYFSQPQASMCSAMLDFQANTQVVERAIRQLAKLINSPKRQLKPE